MKKILFLFAAIFACTLSTFAHDFEVDGIYYNFLGGDSVEVTYNPSYYRGTISIPATVTYNDTIYNVTAIGSGAFEFCYELTGTLTLPNSINRIEGWAFYGCHGLTGSLILPAELVTIGERAFNGCSGLTGTLTLPEGLKIMEDRAFNNCSNLIGVNITTITPPMLGSNVFANMSSDFNITVPCGHVDTYKSADGWKDLSYTFVGSFDYLLTTNTTNEEYGTITITQAPSCENNGVAIIEATPTKGYVFDQWNDGNTDNPRTIEVTQAMTLTASFVPAHLNIYASGLQAGAITNGKVEISYILNAPATALELQLINSDNSVAATIPIQGTELLSKGAHTTTIDLAGIPNDKYTWAIKASAEATKTVAEVTDESKGIYNFYLPQGLAIDNSPESPYFGRIYVSESTNGASNGGCTRTQSTTEGIFIYDQLLNDATEQGVLGYDGGVQWAADRQGPKRLQVAEDGTLFICDNGTSTSGVWMMDPANPSASFKAALDTAGRGTNFVKVAAFDVVGTGEDRVLYTLDNISTSTGTANAYAIGECATPFASAPTSIFDPLAVTMVNQDCALAADGRGGYWIAQNRWGDDSYKALIHVNAEGTADFKSDATLLPFTNNISYRGVLALNKDKSLLAFGSDGTGVVFSIAWDAETGVPTLTELYRTDFVGSNIDGIAFDYADNLYVLSAATERFYAFATPKTVNEAIVPAATTQMIQIKSAGVTTNMLDHSIEQQPFVRKVLENGIIYILRGKEKYTVDGRKIK